MADTDKLNPDRSVNASPVKLVEQLAIELRRRWDNGDCAPIEELSLFDSVKEHGEMLLDLVYHEVLVREVHGESPTVDLYITRFSQHEDALRRLFDVHQSMKEDSSVGSKWATTQTSRAGTIATDAKIDKPDNSFSTVPLASAPPGYELLEEVGRGGMAIVYRARQKNLDRVVALKMLLAGARATPELLARFEQEARTVAQLQHASIVQIHEIGEHDGLPFLALEFLEGGTLKDWLAGRPLPPKEAADAARHLARTMEFAHEQGVVHRDLKPANVLLAWRPPDITSPITIRMAAGDDVPQRRIPQLQTKIGDFGLAHLAAGGDDLTATGQILGTPSYMAPEQAAAETTPNFAQDVYSIGAILYELLTGRPPFQGPTVLDTLDQVRNDDPVPPRRLQPSIPRDLETICLKCLQKVPARRYAEMKRLTDDLQRFQDDRPIAARRATATELGLRWLRRRPAIAMLSVSLTVISIFAVTTIVREARRANESESDLVIQRDEAERMHQLAIEERDAAKANLRQAIEAVESLAEVGERLQLMPNQQQASQEILNNTVTFYEDFVRREDDPESTQLFATSLIRAAEVGRKLGNREAADKQIQRAIDILTSDSEQQPESKLQLTLAYANWARGTLLRSWQRQQESLAAFQACQAVLDASEKTTVASDLLAIEVLRAKADVGAAAALLNLKNEPEALERFAAATQKLRSLAHEADNISVRYNLALCLSHFGSALRNANASNAANVLLEALQECESLVSQDSANPEYRSLLTYALYAVAVDEKNSGGVGQALKLLQRAESILAVLVEDFPSVYEYRFRFAAVLAQQTSMLIEDDRLDDVLLVWKRLCDHLDESCRRLPSDIAFARWSASWQYWFGDYLYEHGDLKLADQHWRRAIESGDMLLQSTLLGDAEQIRNTVRQSRHLALLPTGTHDEKQRAVQLARSVARTGGNAATNFDALAMLGIAEFEAGEFMAAAKTLEEVRSSVRGLGRLGHWYLTMSCWQSGQTMKAQDLAKAIPTTTNPQNPAQFQVDLAAKSCLQMLSEKQIAPSNQPLTKP